MEIKITTKQILNVIQILSWIIFIGLCVEAGGIAFNTLITLAINPNGAHNFWEGVDLATLYNFDIGHFFVVTFIMIIVAVLKAIMFYFIVKLFTEKKLTMSQPFNKGLRHFIVVQSYLALAIGLFTIGGIRYIVWLTKQGLASLDLQSLHLTGADVWLFMSVILLLIVQIVKRGIEIQNENDLTI